jgi:multidrug efflux pump subunit AcrA (membrane-fusion protein)
MKRLLLLALVCATGCAEAIAEPGTPTSDDVPSGFSYSGHVVPVNATDLRAPQNSFRIGGWSSDSGWIKLQHLPPDGSEVKEGDIIAGFEFRGEEARPRVQDRIDKAQAGLAQADIKLAQEARELRTQLKRQLLEAERLELETRKGSVVSQRQNKLAHMAHAQAVFEVKALRQRLSVLARKAASERAFREAELAHAVGDMGRLEKIKSRYSVKAPHDGVLRHARARRERRKVQKGDGMPAGYKFSALALDKRVQLEFYVPEIRAADIKVGMTLVAEHTASGETAVTTVTEIDSFPQEMGFLRDNKDMPGAREKAYVVRARFASTPRSMKAGIEVRVRENK